MTGVAADGHASKRKRHGKDTRVAVYGKRRSDASQFVDRSNEAFEEYYRKQQICPPEEFDSFLEELKVPLGTAFRVTAPESLREAIEKKLSGPLLTGFQGLELGDGLVVKQPARLNWYPGGQAWSFNVPRPVLRKNEKLKEFHDFLKTQTVVGSINRQEVVSMIPPLLLDVKTDQSIIDLCAAPGSKTAQILDMAGRSDVECGKNLIVANDSDLKRCNMLSHQLKRFACPDLVITNHQAQFFPLVATFDRILCDVPCSGDGTLRKAPDLWLKWSVAQAHGLHRLQVAIASRGIRLLKPGGRMVYSTCSFNPVENEAVVTALLREFSDEIDVVDVSNQLPGLKRRKGVRSWAVKDHKEGGAWYSSFDEVPEERRRVIHAGLFAPKSTEESLADKLELCMRLIPQDQDTGGFFVAVLDKRRDAKETKAGDMEDEENPNEGPKENPRWRRKVAGYSSLLSNEPLASIREISPKVAETIEDFFGFKEKWIIDSVYSRSNEKQTKRLSFLTKPVQNLLKEGVYNPNRKRKLRALNAGIRAFERCPRDGADCDYRIVYESIPVLLPYMTKRVVPVPKLEFLKLLKVKNVLNVDELSDKESQDRLSSLGVGTVVFLLKGCNDAVILWRGAKKLTPLMPREEIDLLKLKYDESTDVKPFDNEDEEAHTASAQQQAAADDGESDKNMSEKERVAEAAAVPAP